MDDEPLILGIEINGGDEAITQMQKMAKELRALQSGLDSASVKAQKFAKEMHDAAAGAINKVAKTLHLPSVSISGVSTGSAGGGGGPGAVMGMIKGAGSGIGGILSGAVEMFASALTPVTILLMAAKVAVKAMADAAQEAAVDLRAFRSSMFTSGGTAAETAQLKGISAFTGADAAAMSRSLADHMATGGQASGFAQGAGIHDFGTFDTTDKATNLLKMADYIRNLKSNEEAIRVARVEGLGPLLKLRDVSQGVYDDFKKAQLMAATVRTPQDIRNAANLNSEMIRFDTEADTLGMRLKESLIPGIVDLYSLGADALHKINEEGTKMGKWWQDLMGVPPDRRDGQEDHADALRDNTDAVREAARALKNGTFGGGSRARGAMPGSWGGSNAFQWSKRTATLGAFQL